MNGARTLRKSRPEGLFILLLIFSMVTYPIPFVRLSLGGETPLPIGTFLIPVLAIAVLLGNVVRREGLSPALPLSLAIFFLYSSLLLANIASGHLNAPVTMRLAVFMALPPLFWLGIPDRKGVERATMLLVFVGLVLTLYGFYGYFTGAVGEETGKAWWSDYARYYGIHYLVSTKNADVHFLAVPMVTLLSALLFRGRALSRKWIALLLPVLGLFLLGITLSFSRGAWVSCAATLIMILGYWMAREPRRVAPFLRIMFIALLLLLFLVQVMRRLEMDRYFAGKLVSIFSQDTASQMLSEEISNAGRLRILFAALAVVGDHPLGVGPGNLREYLQAAGLRANHAENEYVHVLAENGVAGLVGLCLLLFYPLASLFGRLRKGRGDWIDASYFFVSVYLTVSFLFNVEFFNFYLWVVHSLIWAAVRNPAPEPHFRGQTA